MGKPRSFKRLHELGPDLVSQVETRLLNGEKPSKIATWLHVEMGVFQDLQLSSLKKSLERYRANDLTSKVVEELKQHVLPTKPGEARKKLNALDEMEEMFLIQKARIDKVLVKEKDLPAGILMKSVSDEMRLGKELLIEMGKLQLETGAVRRAPKTVNGVMFNPDTGEKREFSWTEEQEELYNNFSQFDGTLIEDAEVVDADPAGEPKGS